MAEKVEDKFCFLLYAASRAVTRLYQPLLARLDLTYPQYLVMVVLWEVGGASVKQLGERLMLDSGTLTPLLKRLEGQGFLTRRRDPADERVVRVELTPAGQALQAQAADIPRQVLCDSGLPEAEFAALYAQLRPVLGRWLAERDTAQAD